MINILFIHQSAELYGSDKTLLSLLKHINKLKFCPVVILPFEGPLKIELEKENIKVVIAPVLKLYRKMFSLKNGLTFLTDIKKGIVILDSLNKKYKFDLVYSNTLAVLLGVIYARKRKIKHLWHVHEIIVHPKIIASTFPKLLNKYANVVVCNSFATMKNIVERARQLENKTVVIHNGIDLLKQPHDRHCSKEELGFKSSDIVITLVGRISRLKGHKLLLNTYINYLSSTDNIKLLFVGSPVEQQEYYLEELKQIISKNGLQDKVKILPFAKNLNFIWDCTDIAVMPSTEAESFGLVALEAMFAKKPVVASNHGGLTEIILNNETGFLVAPSDEIALSEVLLKLIENPNLREKFGNRGYDRAIKEFSVDSYVKSFEDLFLQF
jgi:glycosyltransferase involved in cell wall biosynthesis